MARWREINALHNCLHAINHYAPLHRCMPSPDAYYAASRLAMRMVPHLLWIVLEWGVFVALAETGHLLLNRAT